MPIIAGFYFAETNLAKTPRIPVILIHGAGSDHLCWPKEIRRIAGERVLALDLPGHGRTVGLSEQSVQGYGDQVLKFLDALGIFKAVLVGHSLGGAIALWTALHHPARVAGIGLISSGACFNLPAGLLENLSSEVTLPLALDALQSRLFGRQAPKELVEKVMLAFRNVRSSQLKSDWKAAANFDVCGQLSGVKAPTWIAVGEDDMLVPPAVSHYLSNHILNSQLFELTGAGHMMILEQSQKLAEGLVRFIKSLPLDLV